MKNLILLAILVCAIGCAKPADTAPATPDTAAAPTGQASPNQGGVTPMASGAAGGMTPMAGTESVQGAGGGGVGMAAKQMAKDKTANAGGGSVGQMSGEEEQ